MELLQKQGVKTPRGGVAKTGAEAYAVAEKLGMCDQLHHLHSTKGYWMLGF